MECLAEKSGICVEDFGCFTGELPLEEQQIYQRIGDKVEYIAHPDFFVPNAEDRFFGQASMKIDIPQWSSFVDDPEDFTPSRSKKNSLSGQEERELFLRYNFCRYKLKGLVRRHHQRVNLRRVRRMCLWQRRAMTARSSLTRANLALVVAMAKRTRIPNVEFTDMISEGNMALLRSIEKFDVARGFKFSTYACRAILKAFNRLATKTGRYRQYFPTEYDPEMERSDYDVLKHEMQREYSIESLREIIEQNRADLTDMERKVVMERFAIGDSECTRCRTLSQVGKIVGLTNERVRQIQIHALKKIRETLANQYLAA